MVKGLMSTIPMAVVVADDDVTSLLQLSAGVRMSKGQSILAAVAKGDDTICVQAAAGDVAPVTGSFTARMGQQAVMVAAGSVAREAGTFCAAKQDVLLIQRTFGLNTARDFEVALGSKKNEATTTTTTTTTTTPMDIEIFDFEGNLTKTDSVWVGDRWSKEFESWKGTSPLACPQYKGIVEQTEDHELYWRQQEVRHGKQKRDEQIKEDLAAKQTMDSSRTVDGALLQTMDATVADKQQKAKKKAEKKAVPRLDDDQVRVCECRSFLMSSVGKIWNEKLIDTLKPLEALIPDPAPAAPEALLQRNFDAAIATKKKKATTTTTTTTTTTIDAIAVTDAMNTACAAASELPSWTLVSKWINHPDIAALYKAANITEGWQHCDKSWVVHSACGDFLPATLTHCTAHTRGRYLGSSLPNCAQIDWEVPAWDSCRLTDSHLLAVGWGSSPWQGQVEVGACGGTQTAKFGDGDVQGRYNPQTDRDGTKDAFPGWLPGLYTKDAFPGWLPGWSPDGDTKGGFIQSWWKGA